MKSCQIDNTSIPPYNTKDRNLRPVNQSNIGGLRRKSNSNSPKQTELKRSRHNIESSGPQGNIKDSVQGESGSKGAKSSDNSRSLRNSYVEHISDSSSRKAGLKGRNNRLRGKSSVSTRPISFYFCSQIGSVVNVHSNDRRVSQDTTEQTPSTKRKGREEKDEPFALSKSSSPSPESEHTGKRPRIKCSPGGNFGPVGQG